MDRNTIQPGNRLNLTVVPKSPAPEAPAPTAATPPPPPPPPLPSESDWPVSFPQDMATSSLPELGGGQAAHANRPRRTDLPPAQLDLETKVVQALKSIFDPEIPVNIYDLGLIYEIDISPDNSVRVLMTLTAPGCPVAGTLPPEVESRIEHIPEVTKARVELIWAPPWNRDMLSEIARLELGM